MPTLSKSKVTGGVVMLVGLGIAFYGFKMFKA
jgi:hypothetical protein